jgi:arginine-tRNA-protein transferase
MSRTRGFASGDIPGGIYHQFMDAGFRRSGRLVYQPVCNGCRECVSLRVPVTTFTPSKSQRRCLRRNYDLQITGGEPSPDEEKFALYQRYMTQWHGRADEVEAPDAWETYLAFLYDSPVQSLEFCYRNAAGQLLAVGICDVCSQSMSSVYFYHEPLESRRGLGIFGALYEIEFARREGIAFYYLGYWVRGCAAMEYKANFRPCEILRPDGTWSRWSEADCNAGNEPSEGRSN